MEDEISPGCYNKPFSGFWHRQCVQHTHVHPSLRQFMHEMLSRQDHKLTPSIIRSLHDDLYSTTSTSSAAQTLDSHNQRTLPKPVKTSCQGGPHNTICTLPLLLRCEIPSWCTQPSQPEDLNSLGLLPQLRPWRGSATSHRPHHMF